MIDRIVAFLKCFGIIVLFSVGAQGAGVLEVFAGTPNSVGQPDSVGPDEAAINETARDETAIDETAIDETAIDETVVVVIDEAVSTVESLVGNHLIQSIQPSQGEIYMALSSHERGFKDIEKYPQYQKQLDDLILDRAQRFCQARGYLGLAGIPGTEELSVEREVEGNQTVAWVPLYDQLFGRVELIQETFLREKPWVYRRAGRGKVMASVIGALITIPVALPFYHYAPMIVAPLTVGAGLGVGGRIYFYDNRLSPEAAEKHIKRGEQVEEWSSAWQSLFSKSVPHLVFTDLPCSKDAREVEDFRRNFEESDLAYELLV